MPWRLVIFLLIMAVVIFFAGFNINNEADIAFGFHTIEDVPIFISLFFAFLLGAFVMLPFTIFKKTSTKKREKEAKKAAAAEAKEKKRKKKTKKNEDSNLDESNFIDSENAGEK